MFTLCTDEQCGVSLQKKWILDITESMLLTPYSHTIQDTQWLQYLPSRRHHRNKVTVLSTSSRQYCNLSLRCHLDGTVEKQLQYRQHRSLLQIFGYRTCQCGTRQYKTVLQCYLPYGKNQDKTNHRWCRSPKRPEAVSTRKTTLHLPSCFIP